jgi:hypothetical protein
VPLERTTKADAGLMQALRQAPAVACLDLAGSCIGPTHGVFRGFLTEAPRSPGINNKRRASEKVSYPRSGGSLIAPRAASV